MPKLPFLSKGPDGGRDLEKSGQWYAPRAKMGAIIIRNNKVVPIVATVLFIYGILVFVFKASAFGPSWSRAGGGGGAAVGRRAGQQGLQIAIRDPDFGRVTNETLGFEKVVVIGLKERTDKRDAMTLMSTLTGFKVEWVDGIKPQYIPDKAVPYGIDAKKAPDNFLGAWRGHMNALQQ